jgi:hypothetical protein
LVAALTMGAGTPETGESMDTATAPETFTARYQTRPLHPDGRTGSLIDTHEATESTQKLAETVGLCRAMQQAGWSATVYGAVEVRHVESGKTWIVRVEWKS